MTLTNDVAQLTVVRLTSADVNGYGRTGLLLSLDLVRFIEQFRATNLSCFLDGNHDAGQRRPVPSPVANLTLADFTLDTDRRDRSFKT